jgi:hypothetical protein
MERHTLWKEKNKNLDKNLEDWRKISIFAA